MRVTLRTLGILAGKQDMGGEMIICAGYSIVRLVSAVLCTPPYLPKVDAHQSKILVKHLRLDLRKSGRFTDGILRTLGVSCVGCQLSKWLVESLA